MKQDTKIQTLAIAPIGIIRTGKQVKFDTPHQPTDGVEELNVIELAKGNNFEKAIKDLSGFERIWLIWWFHRNKTWRPMVLPPRGGATRRGVFATRSPHRPNPIGITCVRLIKIEGLKLFVGNVDLLDETPILDIKPYLPNVDAYPGAKYGWLEEVEEELSKPPQYSVTVSELARQQLDWLKKYWQVDFFHKAAELLSRYPTPHRTRRISKTKDGRLRMGCGAWRVYFDVNEEQVIINSITPGYPEKLLKDNSLDILPDREAQMAFNEKWCVS